MPLCQLIQSLTVVWLQSRSVGLYLFGFVTCRSRNSRTNNDGEKFRYTRVWHWILHEHGHSTSPPRVAAVHGAHLLTIHAWARRTVVRFLGLWSRRLMAEICVGRR